MTELVQQRTDNDCSVCCLSMLSGRAYDDVLSAVGDCFDPKVGLKYIFKALTRLGFDENRDPVGDFRQLHRGGFLAPEFFRGFAWGRRALLAVPSLNQDDPDALHMVYFDGRSLFDPSTKKTYSRFEELRPDEIVLFREVH